VQILLNAEGWPVAWVTNWSWLASASGTVDLPIGSVAVSLDPGDSILLDATVPGDANIDGMVDVTDLSVVGANWGQSDKTWLQGDFNNDGEVNVSDLSVLGANWGTGTP
jgi:hypothetical protein